ncbi:hypothetical protein [Aeromicrobium sp. UC242_57]|uniref:hypothetical protein n=1 Tax=Aeromicrobium sp. UC242_57 TaxID=3374624 RepID=UPI0037A37FD5
MRASSTSRYPSWDRTRDRSSPRLAARGAVVDASSVEHLHRSTWSIGFDADPGCRPIVDATRHILSTAGLTRLRSSEPDLLVVCSRGEAARSRFERPSLFGTPHLAVVIDEDRVRTGPFVRPGLTPCVGCHDLHRTAWEPAWPALLHQFGRSSVAVGPTALAAPTAHAAAVEIAVDILAVVDGQRPRTTGHCLLVGPQHDERMTWSVPFHPGCSCDLLAAA